MKVNGWFEIYLTYEHPRSQREILSHGKVSARYAFLVTIIEALKSRDIQETLTNMATRRPLAFRQLPGIIIKPNSLRVRTYRKPGTNRHWLGEVVSYELAEPIQEYINSSSSKVIL